MQMPLKMTAVVNILKPNMTVLGTASAAMIVIKPAGVLLLLIIAMSVVEVQLD